MHRYLKTWRIFWSAAAAAEMEYRANFVIAALASLGGMCGSIFALFLFYRTGATLGGWKWQEALLVMGMFTLLDGFSDTLLRPNLDRIVQHVRLGTLDFVLVKPIDSQFWLSTRNVSLWGLPSVALGLGMIVFGGTRLGLGPMAYLPAIVPATLALAVLYSLWFMLGATSIWFVKIYNATEVLRSVMEAGRYPISAYPAGYRFVFTFVVPVAFMTTVPAETILGRAPAAWLLGAACLAASLLLVSRLFWRFALRYYTSASS